MWYLVAWARTSGSTTRARRVAGRILPPICIKSRSTSATLAAPWWISTTSASRNLASGPDLYSPVSFQQTFAKRLIGRFLNSRTAPSRRVQAARSEMAQIFQITIR